MRYRGSPFAFADVPISERRKLLVAGVRRGLFLDELMRFGIFVEHVFFRERGQLRPRRVGVLRVVILRENGAVCDRERRLRGQGRSFYRLSLTGRNAQGVEFEVQR